MRTVSESPPSDIGRWIDTCFKGDETGRPPESWVLQAAMYGLCHLLFGAMLWPKNYYSAQVTPEQMHPRASSDPLPTSGALSAAPEGGEAQGLHPRDRCACCRDAARGGGSARWPRALWRPHPLSRVLERTQAPRADTRTHGRAHVGTRGTRRRPASLGHPDLSLQTSWSTTWPARPVPPTPSSR